MSQHHYKLLTLSVKKGESPHGYIFRKEQSLGDITKDDINTFLKEKKAPPLKKIKHRIDLLTSKKASEIQQFGFHEVVNIVAVPKIVKIPNPVKQKALAYA